MRVELVGGPGTGKTTLCRNLEVIGFNCLFGDQAPNPFEGALAGSGGDFRFPAQMFRAVSKYAEILQYENPELVNVLDRGFLSIRAHTKMLFKSDDREASAIMKQTFDYFDARIGKPDLIVYMKCSPQEQMNRIRERRDGREEGVTFASLIELQSEINMLVTQARIDGCPVVTVDTQDVYLPGNLQYAEDLARHIAGILFQPRDKAQQQARQAAANDRAPLLHYVEMAEAI